jgi:hypothetical protein
VSCAHVHEELGAYVFDALEPEEREAVVAHLAACPRCAAEYERLAALPPMLARAEGLEIPLPPPGVEERLLDRVASEHRGTRTRRPRRWAAAGRARGRALAAGAVAGAALGAAVTAFALGGDDSGNGPAAQYSRVLSGAGGASARADFRHGPEGTEVRMWVKGLPPEEDAVYEVRCEREGWSASAGTFRVDERGRAFVVLTTAARGGDYEWIRVVRRSDPRDTPVLAGEI